MFYMAESGKTASPDTHTHAEPLRFGIMCNGWVLQAWQIKAIRLLEEKGCRPELLIFNDNQDKPPAGWKKLIHYPYNKLFYRLYLRFAHHPASKKPINIKDFFNTTEAVHCRPDRIGHSEVFRETDVIQIKEIKLDFILRFGFNIIRGEILTAARYGVWSFHHGDEQHYRGGPPGFWEIYHGNPVTGAMLQRLTDRLDAGVVLRKGHFRTVHHCWSGSIDQLFMETAHWPAQVATDIMNDVSLSWNQQPVRTEAPVFKVPGNAQMMRFVLSLMISRVRFHFDRLFRAEKWNIGIIRAPVKDILTGHTRIQPEWLLPIQPHRYAADPFAITAPDRLRIFYESYDYHAARGTIASIQVDLNSGRVSPPSTVLEKDYHLAYPYIFAVDGKWHCIPETALNRTVDLYCWDEDAGRLVFDRTLLYDVDAVDSTVFQHDQYWWLFCTRKSLSDTHLYAYYSREFTGPYQPHHNNPIKTDVRSARPAGPLLILDGLLLRPAQDCSVRYGYRITMQKIIRLTPDEFVETSAGWIGPFKGTSFPMGAHTLIDAGDHTVIDAKRYVFDGWNFVHELNRSVQGRIPPKPNNH